MGVKTNIQHFVYHQHGNRLDSEVLECQPRRLKFAGSIPDRVLQTNLFTCSNGTRCGFDNRCLTEGHWKAPVDKPHFPGCNGEANQGSFIKVI